MLQERSSIYFPDAPGPFVDIEEIITASHDDLLGQMSETGWDFHAHLGTHFISQYFLFLQWFGKKDSRFDSSRLVRELYRTQLADGSWKQLPDANLERGELNATIFNYWALKVLGQPLESPIMERAKGFIRQNGGLEGGSLFTRLILALFGNMSWSIVPPTPYLIFSEWLPTNYRKFSQWVIPHLMAIAYLRKHRITKCLGERYELPELCLKPPHSSRPRAKKKLPRLTTGDHVLAQKLLSNQQPAGSWGGYTLSTLLSMMALDHYREHVPSKQPVAARAIQAGFAFVEPLYFDAGFGSYHGALMDGKNWDTLLISGSLLDSGIDREHVRSSVEFILGTQQSNGGFPYGADFEYAPDVDDTAMAVMMLSHFPEYQEQLKKAASWLSVSQNSDGGWGAFDRGNVGNPVLRTLTQNYQDSVELFDASSADITGHILEALSYAGHRFGASAVVRRAVEYLRRTQEDDGTWEGRWGVNYIYGTTCAISGLMRVGVSPSEPFVETALHWLISKQNEDGGFGETTESYRDRSLAGVGVSTPSHTGWVLTALCQAGLARTDAAERAAFYLIEEFKRSGRWKDPTVVGTGHPGLLYMNYPSYAHAFPLMALSLYRRSLESSERLPLALPQFRRFKRGAFVRARLAMREQMPALVRDTFLFVVIRHLARQFNLL